MTCRFHVTDVLQYVHIFLVTLVLALCICEGSVWQWQDTAFSSTCPSVCLLPLFCGEWTTDLPLFMAAVGLTWIVLETVRWGIGQTVWSGEKERKMERGRCNTDTQARVEKERQTDGLINIPPIQSVRPVAQWNGLGGSTHHYYVVKRNIFIDSNE